MIMRIRKSWKKREKKGRHGGVRKKNAKQNNTTDFSVVESNGKELEVNNTLIKKETE